MTDFRHEANGSRGSAGDRKWNGPAASPGGVAGIRLSSLH